jgi:hypothetical protein
MKIMKTTGLLPMQKAMDIVVRAFFGSTAALSLGLLTLTPGAASAQIVEFEFVPGAAQPAASGVLYDNEGNTSPGLTGYVGTVAAGSTFTVGGLTFTMDVGSIIEGVPQGFSGIGVNDVVIQTVSGQNIILGNEQPPAAGPQLWELGVYSGGALGLNNIGLGSWVQVTTGPGGPGGTNGNGGGGNTVPDGGSPLVLSLGSLALLGAAARRFNRVSA